MPRRRSAAKPDQSPDPTKPTPASRPPLPSTARSYGKVTGGKGGRPPVPKSFSHRRRG